MRRRFLHWMLIAPTLLAFVSVRATAQTSKFKLLHSFATGSDGEYPGAQLTLDRVGNVYGTTSGGGSGSGCSGGCGTVFELVPAGTKWRERILYNFSTTSTAYPYVNPTGPMVLNSQGSLYGTTSGGGDPTCECGMVFELTRSAGGWLEKSLYNFIGGLTDGANPYSGLVPDAFGNLYGATVNSGFGMGTAFELSPNSDGSWTESLIYVFTGGRDGADPYAAELAIDADTNLYGATQAGGVYGGGTIFKLASENGGWTEASIYAFSGFVDDQTSSVALDRAGNLYATTQYGGTFTAGSVFELTPTKGYWNYSTVHNFTGSGDGGYPEGGLITDNAGNIYGTTALGGTYQYGTVFKLNRSDGIWKETVLHSFTGGADGATPVATLVFDSAGNLYGTTVRGGTDDLGVVFEITP